MVESSNLSFENKKVLIFGLGVLGGGVGAARFFCDNGAQVRVTDLRGKKELSNPISKLNKFKIKYKLGGHDYADFDWADLVIRNPGVPLESAYLQYCFDNNIKVEMVESLFCKLTKAKVIGITGTRGKTTTSYLIYLFLKEGGFNPYLAGNIPDCATLDLLGKADKNSIVVLELSSWQLQAFGWDEISPQVSLVTNIYEDHLNRYESMDSYIRDKKNIVIYQKKNDIAFLNRDDERVYRFAKNTRAKAIYFSKNDLTEDIVRASQLPGEHNLENIAAGWSVAKHFGLSEDKVIGVLKKFGGVAHRLELVKVIDGVSFVNDTTATTPVAAIAAIESFEKGKIILICGGNKKNLTIEDLAEKIVEKVKAVVYLAGDGTDEVRALVRKKGFAGLDLGVFDKMNKAVERARKAAGTGEVVLLSPGFSSFAMYKNEFERGSDFCKVVSNLG